MNMREILFRGLRTDGKGWAYGALIFYPESDKKEIYRASKEHFNLMENVEVIPETVGQYTGINDASGNKIFEGDCLTCLDEEVRNEVYYDKETSSYRMLIYDFGISIGEGNQEVTDHEISIVDVVMFHEYVEEGALVIGNIHEK